MANRWPNAKWVAKIQSFGILTKSIIDFRKLPGIIGIQPSASNHRHPTTAIQPSALYHRHPTTAIQPPPSNHRHSTIGIRLPHPTAALRPPASHHQHSTTSIPPPACNHQHPTITTQPPPPTNHQHPIIALARYAEMLYPNDPQGRREACFPATDRRRPGRRQGHAGRRRKWLPRQANNPDQATPSKYR